MKVTIKPVVKYEISCGNKSLGEFTLEEKWEGLAKFSEIVSDAVSPEILITHLPESQQRPVSRIFDDIFGLGNEVEEVVEAVGGTRKVNEAIRKFHAQDNKVKKLLDGILDQPISSQALGNTMREMYSDTIRKIEKALENE